MMEKADVPFWATCLRGVIPRRYLSFPNVKNDKIAAFEWHSFFCPDFLELTEMLPVEQQIGDSGVKVFGS
jgi:hypothetical protein